jgi:Fis family transcriptional regulator
MTAHYDKQTTGYERVDNLAAAPFILCDHVRAAMLDYFARLDGQSATDLYAMVIGEVEKPLLETVMEQCERNQTKAARILGVSRSTLRKKLIQYGIG